MHNVLYEVLKTSMGCSTTYFRRGIIMGDLVNAKGTNREVNMNKRQERLYNMSIILFWGALWGITEATVGYILHLMPFRVPTGSVLFPIGYYFMEKSYNEVKDRKAMVYTASVAAFIKLINLFMPAIPVIKVINPAMCILFESLAVVLVFNVFKYKEGSLKFIHALIMSSIWRIGYYMVCFAIFIPLGWMESSSILGLRKFAEFFIMNGLINSLIIYFYAKISSNMERNGKIKYNPLFSIIALGLAFMVQWFI